MDIANAVGVNPDVIAYDYNRLTAGIKTLYKCSVKENYGIDKIIDALRL